MTAVGWAALIVLVVGLVAGLVLVGRSHRAQEPASPEIAPFQAHVSLEPGPVTPAGDPTGVFERSLDGLVLPGDTLVLPDPGDPGLVMVFGSREVAESLGRVESWIPAELATVAVGADALVRAGMSLGEAAGMLVRLTPESTKAVKAGGTIAAEGGAVLGVLRDGSGHFRHIIRFKPAQGLQVAASVTNVLSAVAMQAQLAAIERAIAQLSEQVKAVKALLDIDAAAQRTAVSNVLMSIYDASRQVGMLTQSAWDQVAPLALPVEKVAEEARGNLERLLSSLQSCTSTKERRHWVEANRSELLRALDAVTATDRSRLQYSALRLWWLSANHDPLLEPYTAQMQHLVTTQEQWRAELGGRLGDLLDSSEQTWWWDHVHSPIDSHKMRKLVRELSDTLRDGGIVPTLEPRVTNDEIPGPLGDDVDGQLGR